MKIKPMTAAQVAKKLGVSSDTVVRWCQDERIDIPCAWTHGMWAIDSVWVNAFIREWMPLSQAADILGQSPQAIRSMLKTHKFAAKRMRGTVYVSRSWVAGQTAVNDDRKPTRYQGKNTIVPVTDRREPAVPLIKRKTALLVDRYGNTIGTIERSV